MSSWANSFDEFGDIDTRVPTWNGDGGAQGLEKFSKAARGYVAGMKNDEVELAGPRLWRNLRGESRLAVTDMDPTKLRAADGVKKLLATLAERFPETALKAVPRAYL